MECQCEVMRALEYLERLGYAFTIEDLLAFPTWSIPDALVNYATYLQAAE